MQMVVVALLCVPATGVQGTGNFTGIAIFAAAFTGIACSSVALSLQLYGQKRIAPSRAALILLSEPVFAGIAGYVDGERLSALQLGGAAVILIGIAIAELAPGRPGPKPRTRKSKPTWKPDSARSRARPRRREDGVCPSPV